MRYYISIEKNIEIFEMYKALWAERGYIGIRVDTMTEGIEKAVEIEKVKTNLLYFIDIVADDIDFMSQLKYLSEQTNAPILIATSKPNDDEHAEAIRNGADYYGHYFDTPEKNINMVISEIESIERRARKRPLQKPQLLLYGDILLSPPCKIVLVNGKRIDLSPQEYDALKLLIENKGRVLKHEKIYSHMYDGNTYRKETDEHILHNLIKRLRKKICEHTDLMNIESVYKVGYVLHYDNKK